MESKFKVAWFGPHEHGLSWLLAQSQEHSNTPIAPSPIPQKKEIQAQLHRISLEGVGRVIVACQNRVDYPRHFLSTLQTRFPELPFALAVDNWWDGSRRTGIGEVNHAILPWYRWWDSWIDWLDIKNTDFLGPFVPPTVISDTRSQTEPQSNGRAAGIVVSNCGQTGEGWQLAAKESGFRSSTMSLSRFVTDDEIEQARPAWILWDDSCSDTNQDLDDTISDLLRRTQIRFPNCVQSVSVTLPRWSCWQKMEQAGAVAMFAKPSTGRALPRMLSQLLGHNLTG